MNCVFYKQLYIIVMVQVDSSFSRVQRISNVFVKRLNSFIVFDRLNIVSRFKDRGVYNVHQYDKLTSVYRGVFK